MAHGNFPGCVIKKKHEIPWQPWSLSWGAQAVANLANAYAKFRFASPAAPDATHPARASQIAPSVKNSVILESTRALEQTAPVPPQTAAEDQKNQLLRIAIQQPVFFGSVEASRFSNRRVPGSVGITDAVFDLVLEELPRTLCDVASVGVVVAVVVAN